MVIASIVGRSVQTYKRDKSEAPMPAVARLPDQQANANFKRILFAHRLLRRLTTSPALRPRHRAREHASTVYVVHAIPPASHEPLPLEPLPPELNRRRLEAERGMKDLVNA